MAIVILGKISFSEIYIYKVVDIFKNCINDFKSPQVDILYREKGPGVKAYESGVVSNIVNPRHLKRELKVRWTVYLVSWQSCTQLK